MKGVTNATAVLLVNEMESFDVLQTRTVAKTADQLRKLRCSSTVETREALRAWVARSARECQDDRCQKDNLSYCQRCYTAAAEDLLYRLCVVPGYCDAIRTAPDAMAVILASSKKDRRLLTHRVLRDVLDLAPGGADFFDQVGSDEIRRLLIESNTLEGDRERLGHPLIQSWLTGDAARDNPIDEDYLELVNQLLCDLEDQMPQFKTALAAMSSTADRQAIGAARHALSRRIGSEVAFLHEPLVLDTMHTTRRTLTAWRETWPNAALATPAARRLSEVLDGPPNHRRPSAAWQQLRQRVWNELVERIDLPVVGADPHRNMQRFLTLAGISDLDRSRVRKADLATVPRLRHALSGGFTRGRAACDPASGAWTFPQLLGWWHEFHATCGRAPRPTDVSMSDRPSMQAAVPGPLTDWLAEYANANGLSIRDTSSNHVALVELINELEKANTGMVRATHEEYRDPRIFGQRTYAIDLMAELDPALLSPTAGQTSWFDAAVPVFFEADGQQHFEPVERFGGASQLEGSRSRDTSKADAIGKLVADGEDAMMVSIHHGALTGAKHTQLNATDLLTVLTKVRELQGPRWWVFIRPAGSNDMRACPSSGRKPRRLRLPASATACDIEVFTC